MIAPISTKCLNEDLLNKLSAGDCSPIELADCEDHVSYCGRCRELLDSRTIDATWQSQFMPAFRDVSEPSFVEIGNRNVQQSVLSLLGPTDNPHMLGRIGGYEIVALIGIGGMGIVFKGFDATLDRFVAIKIMQPHLAVSGAARQRFEREGRAAAAVISDFVLPIYAVSEWQGVPYLVMQYSAGTNLQKRLDLHGPLKLCEVLRIAMQTARGLAAAHSQGLVHRDVKPSNILLDGSVERAALTDFGLARSVDDASVTTTGLIAGTPQYMSPEQVRGGRVDARSDLFSLGSTMYAMCTGHSPYRAESSYAVLHRIVGETPQSIREINAEIPDWLEHIITKLLSKDSCQRYDSAEQVAELLEGCLAHVQHPTVNSLPEIMPIRSLRARRWKPFVAAVIALGFLGLILAGTIISRAGKSIRIAAGNYAVVIDKGFENVTVNDGLVTLFRGDKKVVRIKQSDVINNVSPQRETNLYQKLFDAIASACSQDKPVPIPMQLIIDCFVDPSKQETGPLHLAEKQFQFNSIRNVLRTELADGSTSYEFDLDSMLFVEEFLYLLAGDRQIMEAILNGLANDTEGPMIDLRRLLRENVGKRVKLTCDVSDDGSLGYLVEVELTDKDSFMPSFRRIFEVEPNYLTNNDKDLYVISRPRPLVGLVPTVNRIGATVYKNKLYWGSLDKVESIRLGSLDPIKVPEFDVAR